MTSSLSPFWSPFSFFDIPPHSSPVTPSVFCVGHNVSRGLVEKTLGPSRHLSPSPFRRSTPSPTVHKGWF